MAPTARDVGVASGLFRRIFFTFVVTVFAASVVGALGTLWMTRQLSHAWVATTLEVLGEENDELHVLLDRPAALTERVEDLQARLDTRVNVYGIDGRRLAGEGPARAPRHSRRFRRNLEQGHPVVRRPRRVGHTPVMLYPITDPETGVPEAVVHVTSRRPQLGLPFVVSAGFILALLGAGAWMVSRSFTRRLAALERSAERIAKGELDHRVALEKPEPRDEIDELGVAFNEMADKVQALVRGQQVLLANVSHELRTPIARVKVLIELLEDRLEALARSVAGSNNEHVQRLRVGLSEMDTDLAEIEKLIGDLLTSGRLELRHSDESGVGKQPVDLTVLAIRIGDRFAAEVDAPSQVVVDGDELLLERLLSNLLANARRACPDGALAVSVAEDRDWVRVAVEDEGPGIPAADRERVFEAFRRLDEARSRDAGGVGLGLYLCRQIARAHGGDVVALDRLDGASGARMEVTLPKPSS